MENKEFNLSEKIEKEHHCCNCTNRLCVEDVKEFIRLLKDNMVKNKNMMDDDLFEKDEDLQSSNFWINEATLDKFAGEKLK